MNRRFSFILPVRNGGEYIKLCVFSILNQTYHDFDLIILENNSSDGTMEWIRGLNDDRIIIHPASKYLTMPENWARALAIQKNEFMTITGHDDCFQPFYLQIMNELISAYPQSGLYQTHFNFIDSNGRIIRTCKPMPFFLSDAGFLQALLGDKLDTMGTGYMFRSKDYEKAGGIPQYPSLLFADHALWLQLVSRGGISISKKNCFSFRLHQSVSRNTAVVSYIEAFFLFLDFLNEYKEINPAIKNVIYESIPSYVEFYNTSLANRLLKTPQLQRKGMSIKKFNEKCRVYANAFCPEKSYNPYSSFNMRLSRLIDSNPLFLNLYLVFRKIYRRPLKK